MRTRKLLLVLLCALLVPPGWTQQKRWSKAVQPGSRHQDKTTKGKYDPNYGIERNGSQEREQQDQGVVDELESSRGLPAYARTNGETTGGPYDLASVSAYRNNRAIDASRSMETTPGKANQQPNQLSNHPKAKSGEEVREKGRKFKNVTIGDGICQSIDIRNNVNYFRILQGCEVIEGFLQIVLIENNSEADFQNISYPGLREITGYLLLYRVNGLKSLSNLFPNLEVIRGDVLFTDYSFMVYEMQNLQEIGLRKLSKISRGGVRIEKNPALCYTTTLNWDDIVVGGENFIKDNKNESSCPGCYQCPGGYCWTAQHCQQTEKPRCHHQCLGECYGSTESNCYVCKHYRHEGKCVESCPGHLFAYLSRRCITKDECLRLNKMRRMAQLEEEQRWRPFNGTCLTQCPDGYEDENNMTSCRLCKGRCRKIVKGAIIRHISDAQSFRGTTVVNGALEFQIRNGNPNIMNELIDAFGLIEEITEYVKVTHSFPITSLGFFKKLRVIKGEKLDINNASLVVMDNPNLSSLFPPSQQLKIENGRLFFHYNPKLCLSKIEQLGKMVGITNFTDLEVQPQSNGEKVACNIVNINITVKEKGSDFVNLIWGIYKPPRGQRLLSYLLNYIETENENITYEANACGNNTWQIVDVDIPSSNSSLGTITKNITDLKPYTQYAFYVKTFTSRNENSFTSPVGQSEIIYLRTKSDVPSIPLNVVSTALSDTEILVKWNPPEYSNGPIGYYLIAGFIRPDDIQFLSSRNYCEEGLVNEPDMDEVQEITVKTPVINPASCCSKDANGKTTTSKKFQIFCHENITISHLAPGWKDYCVFNRYNSVQNEFYDLTNTLSSQATDKQASVSYAPKHINDQSSFLFNVSASNNSYVLSKLRHYSVYTTSIVACGVKLESNVQMCSSVQYTSTRTKKRESADDVHNVKIHVTDNSIVEVSWDPAKDPNALTVAYDIEYTNLDVKDAKKSTDCLPYTIRRNKRNTHTIQNLTPGKYSLRVRSMSLAGDGAFSEMIYFSVGTSYDNSIIIITGVTLVGLGMTLLIAYMFYKNHQKKKKQERLIASVNPDYIETKYIIDSWEVPRENVEILEELGLGNFGMVYRGRLENNVQVAIKTISDTANEREKNEFLNEASVMKNFSTFHIIKLLGVVSIGNPPFVIMELMENGDLKTYLRTIRDTHLVPNASRVIRMAAEIADGMAYLESKKFVHRDLAARNCMVSKDLVCKIGDFGMARDIYETDYYKIGKKGLLPIRWMAPENLSDGVFTSDSDVWSFGVVLYEILTLAEIPYQGFANEQVLNYVLHKGVLNIPRCCPENIYNIMEKCFKWKPNDRPTFMEIVAELEPFLGQDFCEKSFYHSQEGVEIRSLGIKKVYHHAAPIRFHWGNETARWVREFEDNVTLLDQTKAGTSRGRIFRNGCQHFGNVSNFEDVPLDR